MKTQFLRVACVSMTLIAFGCEDAAPAANAEETPPAPAKTQAPASEDEPVREVAKAPRDACERVKACCANLDKAKHGGGAVKRCEAGSRDQASCEGYVADMRKLEQNPQVWEGLPATCRFQD